MPGDHHHIHYVPESPEVGMTFVGWSAFGSLLLLLVAIGGLYAIFHAVVPSRTLPAPKAFPQPRVEPRESDELRRINDAQTNQLEIWQWSDSQHSMARVPIERAMELLGKKGADAYAPLLPQAALSPPTAAAERAAIQHGRAADGAPDGAAPSLPESRK